jgi:hypothetical protein
MIAYIWYLYLIDMAAFFIFACVMIYSFIWVIDERDRIYYVMLEFLTESKDWENELNQTEWLW